MDDARSAPQLPVAEAVDELQALLDAMASGSTLPEDVDLDAVCDRALASTGGVELAEVLPLLARAVELKARALLPVPPPAEPEPEVPPDEEAEAAALAERLAEYRAFADAALALRDFETRRQARFGRPAEAAAGRGRAAQAPEPGLDGDLERLIGVFAEVWERAQPRIAHVDRERATVAGAAASLRQRLASAGTLEFGALFAEGADRLEVVVTFLALLELARLGEVAVEQSAPFAPLRITWRGAVPGAGARGSPS